jgi:hypothetical protein
MQIPEEFVTLCRWFHQDCDYGHETAEEMIEGALCSANLSLAQRNVVRVYIDELVSGKYNDEELHRIWRKSGAGVSITRGLEGDTADFLRRIRSVIDSLNRRSCR